MLRLYNKGGDASVVGKDVPGCPRMSHGCVVGCRRMRTGWVLWSLGHTMAETVSVDLVVKNQVKFT